jgi:predicted RNA-binding Zn-ribbon protein involved in translation (DUF1610 family)
MTIVHLAKRPREVLLEAKTGGGVCVRFNCPNCNALYQLIKAEAGPETVDRAVTCLSCGAPLPIREADFVLKYFLLRKPQSLVLAYI